MKATKRNWKPGVVLAIGTALGLFSGYSVLQARSQKAADHSKDSLGAVVTPLGEVIRGPRGKSQIAITFDGGANAECFADLIAALEKARVRSTFFITGNFAQRNVECAKAITKHGHEIGNHTWSHADLTKQADEFVREEITQAEILLTDFRAVAAAPTPSALRRTQRARLAHCGEPGLPIDLLDHR